MWSAGAESWTLNSVGRPSKGMLLCPLPHCGVEITLGVCTETDLKLQASVHALQSGACRQQDWHDVPSPLTPVSPKPQAAPVVLREPPACRIQNTPTNLINFHSQLYAPVFLCHGSASLIALSSSRRSSRNLRSLMFVHWTCSL